MKSNWYDEAQKPIEGKVGDLIEQTWHKKQCFYVDEKQMRRAKTILNHLKTEEIPTYETLQKELTKLDIILTNSSLFFSFTAEFYCPLALKILLLCKH